MIDVSLGVGLNTSNISLCKSLNNPLGDVDSKTLSSSNIDIVILLFKKIIYLPK
jgi:hypothetical protein